MGLAAGIALPSSLVWNAVSAVTGAGKGKTLAPSSWRFLKGALDRPRPGLGSGVTLVGNYQAEPVTLCAKRDWVKAIRVQCRVDMELQVPGSPRRAVPEQRCCGSAAKGSSEREEARQGDGAGDVGEREV